VMYHTYVLRSLKDGRRYVGYTANLRRRLEQHNLGLVAATRSRRPLVLLYEESFARPTDARSRERFFKSWAGRYWLAENQCKSGRT
jgi:putative endonuclease